VDQDRLVPVQVVLVQAVQVQVAPARVLPVREVLVREAVRGDQARVRRTGVLRRTAGPGRPGHPVLRGRARRAGFRRCVSIRPPDPVSTPTGPDRRPSRRVR
jgi:hypothetical protein